MVIVSLMFSIDRHCLRVKYYRQSALIVPGGEIDRSGLVGWWIGG